MSPHHDNVCYVWSWLMVDSIDDWWGWLVLWWQTSTKYKDAEKRCIEHFLGIFTVIITHNIDVFSCIILFFFTHHRPHVSIKRQMTQKRCWFWEIIYILVQDFSSSIFHLVRYGVYLCTVVHWIFINYRFCHLYVDVYSGQKQLKMNVVFLILLQSLII